MLAKLFSQLPLLALALSCKTAGPSSETREATPFSPTNVVDLTRYKEADAATFQKMKLEMKAHKFDYDHLRTNIDALPSVPAGVDKDELVAIRLYTSSAYQKVNQALRTRNPSTLPEMEAIIKAASSGLNKLPASPCIAKRGTGLPENIFNALGKNVHFVDCAFMSTTYGDIPPAFRKNITFEIESDRCVKIDWMSEFPTEKEVLFPPGSEFFVTERNDVRRNGETVTKFKMKHIMSGDAMPSAAHRKIDCMNITELSGSPGTTGFTPVPVKKFIDRPFVSESSNLRIKFSDDGKAERRKGSQRNSCRWIYANNKFTVDCSGDTQHYFAFSANRIGLMAGAASDQIGEYLAAQ